MPDTRTGELLGTVIGDLVAGIRERREPALADEPDAVHQLRTSVRRLRNVLAGFGRYVEKRPARELRDHLASYGAVLGAGRDLEVRAEDCRRVLAELGRTDLEPALVAPLLAAHGGAHAVLVDWHASPDAVALDRLLEQWAEDPPFTHRARRPAGPATAKVLRREVRRVLDRAADGETSHEVRKAARRLRHVADALGEAALASAGKDIQGRLGDHRDALLLAGHLGAAGAPAAVIAHVETAASRTLDGLPEALAALREVDGS
ncbi:CHAD domain-containing protein [Nocardioides daeguensis]|uniref:CHAD domain-containing protein n=1 Tax=Nocardioides daeguensis TaxID=908359 RepID=A0ABP6WLK5_9ACTN|nr:CHAD domain-containing protein [Nocardioides daeguensis]MBV6729120.1 CHAD domain-containing protein [Nocardioides daeguensis]MCR1774876.1 CHAD domain-containing protein [Nocardioides daeguensis]